MEKNWGIKIFWDDKNLMKNVLMTKEILIRKIYKKNLWGKFCEKILWQKLWWKKISDENLVTKNWLWKIICDEKNMLMKNLYVKNCDKKMQTFV